MARTNRGGNAELDGKPDRGGEIYDDEEVCRGQGEDPNRTEGQCGNELSGGHEECAVAMAWTRIAKGEDAYAVALVRQMGYARALEWVAEENIAESGNAAQAGRGGKLGSVVGLGSGAGLGGGAGLGTVAGLGGGAGRGLTKARARWKARLAALGPGVTESNDAMGFVMPGDPLWPAALDDLGDTRPLGPWSRGDDKMLARTGAAVVGSRGSSPYDVKVATDVAYELADSGVNVVSGGAFGIDIAAHRGMLAAGGHTVVVSACGVDRYYPASHANLCLEILRRGGAICSEAPPGAAPHKHRFLSRNRIIATPSRAVVAVEAPFRSGAISTAHHAMSIGRPAGTFPDPVTPPGSSGCYRLLREGATCVTQIREVLEPMGMEAKLGGQPGPGEPPTPGGLQTERQLTLDVLDPLVSRVCEALPVSRGAPAEKVAAVAGVSVTEALTGPGRPER